MVKKKISKLAKEFRKTTLTALVAALGLVIGLTWNDVVKFYFEGVEFSDPLTGKILGALIITFLAVIAIVILTRFMPPKE